MFSLHFLLDLAMPLGAASSTIAVSVDVEEQQWHQGPFGSLNPSPCHAEWGHKPSVTCIQNLILPVTTQKPHEHRSGTHGRLTRKQRFGSDAQNRRSNSLSLLLPLPDTPELFFLDHRTPLRSPPFIQERTMSSEMAVLPEPDSSLKLMYFSSKNANLCSKSPPKSNQIIYYRGVHDRFLRETCGVCIMFLACIVLDLLCSQDCAYTYRCHNDCIKSHTYHSKMRHIML